MLSIDGRTEQEIAWAGEHGNEYNKRAPGDPEANYALFQKALNITVGPHVSHKGLSYGNHPGAIVWADPPIATILELGAGTGANVRALNRLYPSAHITAVELNRQACETLQATTPARVVNANVLDWEPDGVYDLVVTKGLLIHIHPDELVRVYETIMRAAGRWVLIAEYYNPTPVNVIYRGRDDLLWKRDFAGDLLDRYGTELRLRDYGFVYRRDRHPQDDITWFLLEKV